MKKRVLSLFISVLLILTALIIPANAATKKALPLSAGIKSLRNQFESGVASKAGDYALDYSFYSPVGKSDNQKYPIVIFLHGIGHGSGVGSELKDSTMAYWSSSELQSRWKDTSGAFILLPRSPEDKLEYWNKTLINPLRVLIDDFIREHKNNVDTTRIFIGGSSAGGEMAWDMAIAYPEYFAGIYPMAATGTRSTDDIKEVKNVAIWCFASTLDPIVSYPLNVEPQWDKICKYSSRPQDCRLSKFGQVKNPDGSAGDSNHRLFTTISYDFFTDNNGKYPNVETVNGNGAEVSIEYPNGMISWMSNTHSTFKGTDSGSNLDVNIFQRVIVFFRNIMLRIGNIFQRLFGFV